MHKIILLISIICLTYSYARAPSNGDVKGRVKVEITPLQRQLIDIRTTSATYENVDLRIRAVGIVTYDQSNVVDVNFKIEGWIQKLYVDKPGQFIRKGQPLMDLYSPALYSGQEEYLIAIKYYKRLQSILEQKKAMPPLESWEMNIEGAKALVESSHKRLRLWDIPSEEITALEESGKPTDTMQLKSSIEGYVIEKNIYPGAMIMPGTVLYRVADLSQVWVNAEFYEFELPLIAIGQNVSITLDALPNQTIEGKVDFIYPYLENKTRTTTARIVISNNKSLLKPSMYANIELKRNLGIQLVVPANAIFNTGLQQYVFVQQSEGIFLPCAVKIGPRAGDKVVIYKGLSKGDKVVVDGNFLIDSESQLRASRVKGDMHGH